MKARLAFKAAVPEKVVINGSVGGGEAQTRGKGVLELLADEFGAGLFGFHDEIREMEWSAKRRQRRNTGNAEARAQRGAANSSQPTANSERQRQSKQSRNTENTETGAQRAQRGAANNTQ